MPTLSPSLGRLQEEKWHQPQDITNRYEKACQDGAAFNFNFLLPLPDRQSYLGSQ
jgi:hypothetical protein